MATAKSNGYDERGRHGLDRIADERFARILALLLEQRRILMRLAEIVGEKIVFRTPIGTPETGD